MTHENHMIFYVADVKQGRFMQTMHKYPSHFFPSTNFFQLFRICNTKCRLLSSLVVTLEVFEVERLLIKTLCQIFISSYRNLRDHQKYLRQFYFC